MAQPCGLKVRDTAVVCQAEIRAYCADNAVSEQVHGNGSRELRNH